MTASTPAVGIRIVLPTSELIDLIGLQDNLKTRQFEFERLTLDLKMCSDTTTLTGFFTQTEYQMN